MPAVQVVRVELKAQYQVLQALVVQKVQHLIYQVQVVLVVPVVLAALAVQVALVVLTALLPDLRVPAALVAQVVLKII